MTYQPRRVVGASQNGRSLEEIRFGALVQVVQGTIQSEHIFLGWNEDHTKLWLARPPEGPLKRGPLTQMLSQELVVSFQNVERYEPLFSQRAWACLRCSTRGGVSHHLEGETCPNGSIAPWLRDLGEGDAGDRAALPLTMCPAGHTSYEDDCLGCSGLRHALGWEKW